MVYWQIFKANFIANMLGYGGGPATIPLLEHEVVNTYHWYTTQEFSEIVALGNGLPGPIATKLAAQIGFDLGGTLGAFIALVATIAPTMILMLILLGVLMKFKHSPIVVRLTLYVRPAIAVLLGAMTYNFFFNASENAGITHTAIIAGASFLLLEKFKVNPVYVVLGALLYGGIFLS
ncbi:MAG TPA: chromate transporter [Bacillota bacterium]|nr:chromate transporter [Bacillota bacterium]